MEASGIPEEVNSTDPELRVMPNSSLHETNRGGCFLAFGNFP